MMSWLDEKYVVNLIDILKERGQCSPGYLKKKECFNFQGPYVGA